MSEYKKNIAIGLTIVTCTALFLWVLLFLHPKFGDEGYRFHVRFSDVEKVTKGSRVTFAGRPVGHVIKISTLPREINNTAKSSPLYSYDVLVAIDSHIQVYTTDTISLSTSGLMGERYIAITPNQVIDGQLIKENQIVYASEVPTMSETLKHLSQVAVDTQVILQSVQEEQVIQKVALFLEKSSSTADAVNMLITKITDGDGTLGRLVTNDDFYFKSTAMMNKANLLLSDLNNYGLFYNMSGKWKKEQKTRDLSLRKVRNPEEFSTFLNERLIQISSSLNSLKMAAEKAQSIETKEHKKITQRSLNAALQEIRDIEKELVDLQQTVK